MARHSMSLAGERQAFVAGLLTGFVLALGLTVVMAEATRPEPVKVEGVACLQQSRR